MVSEPLAMEDTIRSISFKLNCDDQRGEIVKGSQMHLNIPRNLPYF